ncbi:TMEM175 family protein [Solimonas marina]|uniref:DUF1211 domain-containing protein n=1 Tax=Solimonas marina TaxID=2714601 RepID=A0A970B6T3_9GAMM|nr:DUF1211 domain-containing protein [Solimonas marina]
MGKGRLEAFSDGVIAIIITIMVLELKVPHEPTLEALHELWPTFLSYVLSFVYVGIYWNNHHHLMHTAQSVSGGVMWANLHFLFWLSLFPFTTAWMGENHFEALPTALYGVVLLMAAASWVVLQFAIMRHDGCESPLRRALGRDLKGKLSPLLYLSAIALSFYQRWIADLIYVAVAMMWLVPDRRIESPD